MHTVVGSLYMYMTTCTLQCSECTECMHTEVSSVVHVHYNNTVVRFIEG